MPGGGGLRAANFLASFLHLKPFSIKFLHLKPCSIKSLGVTEEQCLAAEGANFCAECDGECLFLDENINCTRF